jgi:phosphotransferase system HPr-like phosphotransfer protein
MVNANITLPAGRTVNSAIMAKIVKKCRECKSRVCVSRGEIRFADCRSLNEMRHLGAIQDPRISIEVTGADELKVMCDLVDMINHGR